MKELTTVKNQWPALVALCEDERLFSASNSKISTWGVDKQLSHVAMALDRIGKNVESALQVETESVGNGPNKMGHLILKLGYIPRGKGQAPQYVIPEERPDREQVRDDLARARSTWESFFDHKELLRTSRHVIPHHLLGDFIPAQWVRFAGVHTKHHLKIIFDILRANGLSAPKASEVAINFN